MNLRDKDGCRDDNAVEGESHDVRDNLTHQKEVVDDMKFLPDRHFLRTQTNMNIRASNIAKPVALIL
jgi:hypothetical protein